MTVTACLFWTNSQVSFVYLAHGSSAADFMSSSLAEREFEMLHTGKGSVITEVGVSTCASKLRRTPHASSHSVFMIFTSPLQCVCLARHTKGDGSRLHCLCQDDCLCRAVPVRPRVNSCQDGLLHFVVISCHRVAPSRQQPE